MKKTAFPIRTVQTLATIVLIGVVAATQGTNDKPGDAAERMTAVATGIIDKYLTPAVCSYSPTFCAKHQLQARGIQSYLATAGTMLAGVLGVILMKIKILIVLTLISTIVGKLLLFYAFLKSDHFHHYSHKPHHVPFVKYTKDKYFIKHSPHVHSQDVVVDDHGHSPYSNPHLSGISYYKR
ncbi:uncharacterized protein LOC126847052 [Adelges cooleyi]|uniref:uncharacterized protein LOC126847052 n=1 Tax=Adelges cooleyi TaxID=133065 RepID=UPI0021802C59|nr:uncharacterized protein LOC126847052 [Adelges cooleyi]